MKIRDLLMTAATLGCVLVVPLSMAQAQTKVKTTMHASASEHEARSSEDRRLAPSTSAKPLSPQVKKGLDWLIEHQLPNGAWGQGEESRQMGSSMAHLTDKGNVADTCMATLALIRAGSSPSSGPHATAIQRALGFVMGEIEESDRDSLYVTQVRGTRVQGKIGPYVDTFLSSQLLAEVKGKMPDESSERRLTRALNKVLAKIETNQREDGSFEGQAWAPVLSQAMAAKGVNRAAQAGVAVDDSVVGKLEGYARGRYDEKAGSFGGEGSAGVDLYGAASAVGELSDSVNTYEMEEDSLKEQAEKSKDAAQRKKARDKLDRIARAKSVKKAASESLSRRLGDPGFVSGFGNNGGEEFLSYMLVSESLMAKGGEEWRRWDAAMAQNLNRVQNRDGSWTGHHCITGRTFVTSAALLVLTADRAPVPLAAKLRRG